MKEKPNCYIPRIDKQAVQDMPMAVFDGEVTIIDQPEQVEEAVAYLRRQTVVGVDTESRPSFTRGIHYPTALLQIATEQRCFLFRLTHIGMPQTLCDLFADNGVCKVGLAFKDDLNGLKRRRNFMPRNCIDIQSMAWKYGILDLGLQKIFANCFGKKISKAQQLTNWENTTLTTEQARYASTDAWATLLIYKQLIATKPLPKQQADELRQKDKEAQLLHQQEILAQRTQEEKTIISAQSAFFH